LAAKAWTTSTTVAIPQAAAVDRPALRLDMTLLLEKRRCGPKSGGLRLSISTLAGKIRRGTVMGHRANVTTTHASLAEGHPTAYVICRIRSRSFAGTTSTPTA